MYESFNDRTLYGAFEFDVEKGLLIITQGNAEKVFTKER